MGRFWLAWQLVDVVIFVCICWVLYAIGALLWYYLGELKETIGPRLRGWVKRHRYALLTLTLFLLASAAIQYLLWLGVLR